MTFRGLSYRLIDRDHIEISGRRHRFYVVNKGDAVTVWLDGRTYEVGSSAASPAHHSAAVANGEVSAIMPGKILRVDVSVGDAVSEKQTLAIMESMKMETALIAPVSGRVSEIHCQPGQIVEMGEVLIVIADA